MEPKIVDKPAISLIGMVYFGDPSTGEFAKTWDRFMKLNVDIPGRTSLTEWIGLEFYTEDFWQNHKWFYMVCVETKNLDAIPLPLVAKHLPACTYAVFTVRGGLKKLGEGFHYVYETWLPNSGYQVAYPFDFEFYQDGRFKGDEEESEIDIYIPIALKR
jgi:AraC family transcriptional regulator